MEIKKFLLYSIIPALVAGLFSIAPKFYETVSEPRASLTYKIVEGPKIVVNGEQQQVTLITFKNSGSKTLNSVKAELSIEHGSMPTYSTSSPSALPLKIDSSPTSIRILSTTMLEGESFSISTLLKSPDGSTLLAPKINIRSKEVLGKIEASERPRSSITSTSLGGALAGLSVFLMSLLYQIKSGGISLANSRGDLIFYIAIATDTEKLLPNLNSEINKLTYLRFSELLLKHGLSDDKKEQSDAQNALKCLLMVNMHNSSKDIVERNLKRLTGKTYNPELSENLKKKGKELNSPITFRNAIDDLIARDKINPWSKLNRIL